MSGCAIWVGVAYPIFGFVKANFALLLGNAFKELVD